MSTAEATVTVQATTATPPAPVQLTRSAAGIDAAVALLSSPDGNLEDALMLLRRVAVADLDAISTDNPAARIQGLVAFVAQRLRQQYGDDVRTAPPAALNELVRDAAVPCQGPHCLESLLPWTSEWSGEQFCSDACRNDDMRERGE